MPPARRARNRQAPRVQAPVNDRPRRAIRPPRRLRDEPDPPADPLPAHHDSDSEPDPAPGLQPPPEQAPQPVPPQPDVARLEALEQALQQQSQQLNALLLGVGLPHHPPPLLPAAAGAPPPDRDHVPGEVPPLVPVAAGAPQAPPVAPPPAPVPLPLQQDPLMAHIVGAAATGNGILPEHLNAGALLAPELVTAITSKQFVDLKSLSSDPSPSSAVIFSIDTSTSTPRVSLDKPLKLINNFREWLSLFATYASVYTSAHPQEAPALFTYMIRIHELSQEPGYLWRTYDEAFRKLKARSPHILYQEHNPQLLNTLRHKETLVNSNLPFRQQNQQGGKPATLPAPPSSCHRYFYKGSCTNPLSCRYKHICGHCHTPNHTRFSCNQSPPTPKISNTTPKRS